MTTTDKTDLDVLWQPLQIGPVTVPNRIAMSPITTMWVTDQTLTEQHIAYYAERARGGAGMLISEQHTADRERKGFSRHIASALDERSIPVLRRLAEEVHAAGSIQFVQLYGPGILDQIGIDAWGWMPPLSPSGVVSAGFGEVPSAVTAGDLADIIRSFARAARNVAAAGLDGVELHSARSELLGQFLSPLYNLRKDEYGGSARRRTTLLIRVVEAIREQAPGLAVGAQLSVDEYMGPAALTPELALEQLEILTATGLFDYINLSTGNEFTDDVTIPPMESDEIPTAEFGRLARKAVGERTKLLLNGGVRDLATAAALIADGAADLVSMSRPLVADPHLVRKAREGRLAEITPCLGHNDCLRSVMLQRPMTCLMNPVVGRESSWTALTAPRRASSPRRVVVIGGGPAGLRAAVTAADAGHMVSLFESSSQLGGRLVRLAQLPHRSRWQKAIDWYVAELRRAGVDVHVGTSADARTEQVRQAEVVLVATGAVWAGSGDTPFRPDRRVAPGTDADNVLDVGAAIDATATDPRALGGHVIVVDDAGDYEAAGLVDRLSAAGVEVDVVTRNPGPFARVAGGLDHAELFKRLSAQGVRVHAGRFLDRIEAGTVHSVELWSGRPVAVGGADTIVLAMGRVSRTELSDLAQHIDGEVIIIGGAVTPRETRAVVAEAHAVALGL